MVESKIYDFRSPSRMEKKSRGKMEAGVAR